ncbi:hypothetical protein GCM10010320_81580 [Streptomyces caelestis]|jgi:hypothetical protein|uniref:Uncharacterized protein n=1 Tax=Streptomyces caelestis TaxID=36816 RepID=A0A7W9GYM0_9ACTN|nr:hypothetical protein [Streptomyces caelestis]GGW87882.1 hypothetical protein GCM10010320_81580 [Streptomyces caelestis]
MIRPGHLTAHQTARVLGSDRAGVRKLVQCGQPEWWVYPGLSDQLAVATAVCSSRRGTLGSAGLSLSLFFMV